MQYPRCLFTAEFRDGFIDGFTDYLDRGGSAAPPAVPPKKYQRNKYLNAEGHALIQDWFLGYQYGIDVAIATGQRKFLTVPVLLPDDAEGPVKFKVQREGNTSGKTGTAEPLGAPRPMEEPPARSSGAGWGTSTDRVSAGGGGQVGATLTSRPQASKTSSPPPAGSGVPGTGGATKFTRPSEMIPSPDLSAEDRLPQVNVPVAPLDEESLRKLIPLPPPPSSVPVLPEGVPTPSVLDDLPMIPAAHMFPPPLPVASPPAPALPPTPVPEATRKGP